MLNQFIQIRIQIRNAGSAATGCLIDGLIDVVHGFLGHMARLVLTPFGQPQSDSGLGARSRQLGKRDWLLRPRYGYWPRAGELWLQG